MTNNILITEQEDYVNTVVAWETSKWKKKKKQLNITENEQKYMQQRLIKT